MRRLKSGAHSLAELVTSRFNKRPCLQKYGRKQLKKIWDVYLWHIHMHIFTPTYMYPHIHACTHIHPYIRTYIKMQIPLRGKYLWVFYEWPCRAEGRTREEPCRMGRHIMHPGPEQVSTVECLAFTLSSRCQGSHLDLYLGPQRTWLSGNITPWTEPGTLTQAGALQASGAQEPRRWEDLPKSS